MDVPVPLVGPLRALRAGALTVAALALALAAHLVAGGRLPPAPALLGAAVVLGCVATMVTGQRLGRSAIWAGLAGSQGLLHLWLGATSRVSGCGWLRHGGWSSDHLHGSPLANCLSLTGPPASPMPTAGLTTGHFAGQAGHYLTGLAAHHLTAMLAAHLLAVLLTGWLLAQGEALLWRLWDRLLDFVQPPRPARPPASTRSPQGWFPAPVAPPADRRILPARRGPPVGHAPS
jgi:hypothetical protein